MNITKNSIIGIWGFGSVGQSVAHFLHARGHKLCVMSKDVPRAEDKDWLRTNNISFYTQDQKDTFFSLVDYILPSPGIDIRPYRKAIQNKLITEPDLFAHHWHKPIIAITGTVGKTTITHILHQLLARYNIAICTGGNIGTGMCSFIMRQDECAYALLELSSFQLEHCKLFTPDLAIITNITPNHLDRHTADEYRNAKLNICARQTNTQRALVPLELLHNVRHAQTTPGPLYLFSSHPPTADQLEALRANDHLFYINKKKIITLCHGKKTNIIDLSRLPPITFDQNWLIICTVLDLLGCDLSRLPSYAQTLTMPPHRMEKLELKIKDKKKQRDQDYYVL